MASAGDGALRPLDFLVIGAPQSGTTSLWRAFDSHPQIQVPSDKERGFFNSDNRFEKGLDRFVSWTFRDAGKDQLLGTITPQLMPPEDDELDLLVRRISDTCPAVQLIAIMRNPIDRAISHFRRGKRVSGGHEDDFDAFTARMERKFGGLDNVPFIKIGQYGRIMSRYLEKFDRDQIKILFTEDLEKQPRAVYRDAFSFLGVNPEHDPGNPHLNVGGTSQRINEAALDQLFEELERVVWPHVADDQVPRGFTWWVKHIWNCEPDNRDMEVSDDLRSRMAEIYLVDEAVLRETFGVEPPWAEALASVRA